jgi:hypothetical protein
MSGTIRPVSTRCVARAHRRAVSSRLCACQMQFPGTGTNWLQKTCAVAGPQDQQKWPDCNLTTGSLSPAKLAPFFAATDTHPKALVAIGCVSWRKGNHAPSEEPGIDGVCSRAQ